MQKYYEYAMVTFLKMRFLMLERKPISLTGTEHVSLAGGLYSRGGPLQGSPDYWIPLNTRLSFRCREPLKSRGNPLLSVFKQSWGYFAPRDIPGISGHLCLAKGSKAKW